MGQDDHDKIHADAPVVRHLEVRRSARYFLAGDLGEVPDDIWFVLHGYGQDAGVFLTEFESLHRPGRWFVAPEGLSRFYAKGSDGAVGASWMTRVDRETEIADTLRYLDSVRSRVMEEVLSIGSCHDSSSDAEGDAGGESGTCRPRTTVLGFSQGGAAACRFGLRAEPPVDRIISWAGGLPADICLSTSASLPKLPRLEFVVGTRDRFLTPGRVEEEEERLTKAGVCFRLHRFDGGHRLDRATLGRLAADDPVG